MGCTVCQARPFDPSRLVVFHWPPHITLNNKCYFPKCQNYFSGPLSDGTVVVLQTKREPLEDTTTDVLGDIGLLAKVGCMRSYAKYDWNRQQQKKWDIFFSPIPVVTFVFSYFHQIWGWRGGAYHSHGQSIRKFDTGSTVRKSAPSRVFVYCCQCAGALSEAQSDGRSTGLILRQPCACSCQNVLDHLLLSANAIWSPGDFVNGLDVSQGTCNSVLNF